MGIIADIKKYVTLSLSPKIRFEWKSADVFDTFINVFEKIYLENWFRNVFIEKLIEEWHIAKPMMIYSPRKAKWTTTNGLVCPWVYRNTSGHIYYDPDQLDEEQFWVLNKRDFEIKIKLPDTIALLYLSDLSDTIFERNKLYLKKALLQWN